MAEIDARPLFVDNQDGNTLARAIKAHLEALRDAGKTPAELCVTSAYFNPQGLELLARELRHAGTERAELSTRALQEDEGEGRHSGRDEAERMIPRPGGQTDPRGCPRRRVLKPGHTPAPPCSGGSRAPPGGSAPRWRPASGSGPRRLRSFSSGSAPSTRAPPHGATS